MPKKPRKPSNYQIYGKRMACRWCHRPGILVAWPEYPDDTFHICTHHMTYFIQNDESIRIAAKKGWGWMPKEE